MRTPIGFNNVGWDLLVAREATCLYAARTHSDWLWKGWMKMTKFDIAALEQPAWW